MRRLPILIVGLVAIALVFGGAAAAQPVNETVENQTEKQPDEEIAEQMGDLKIHEYDYSNGEFVIIATWEGTIPTEVTLTEMIELDSGGSSSISFQQVRLMPGERTEITIPAEEQSAGYAAVLLTTPQSVERGEGIVLQSDDPREYPAIRFQNVVLAVSAGAIGSAALAFVFVLRRKHAEEHGMERIA